MDLSVASAISNIIAAAETDHLHQQYISPDLLIAGITKLQDFIDNDSIASLGLRSEYVPIYQAECLVLLTMFDSFPFDIREFRRNLRRKVGMGSYVRPSHESISRTDQGRKAFDRAEELAKRCGKTEITVNFLFAALLEIENTAARALLSDEKMDWQVIYQAALDLDMDEGKELLQKAQGNTAPNGPNGESILEKIGKDLVQMAREGKINQVIGRDPEIKRTLTILSQKTQRNPLLIGEAGVGKTAVVEGIAYLIARGLMPYKRFANKRIIQIDAAALVGGTNYRGDFEERMQKIIREAERQPDLILFIDEIHMLIGAGSTGHNQIDAANMLKPALASGNISIIGATTEQEYRRYIASDPPLNRRFQAVVVKEPSPELCRQILLIARDRLQNHHGVQITEDAIDAAIELSTRYMVDRRLPEKAFTLIDSACAQVLLTVEDEEIDDPEHSSIKVITRDHILQALPSDVEMAQDVDKIDLLKMADYLKERVVGQPQAADAIANAVKRNALGLSVRKRPVGVFLFVGPTGVGKTEIARTTAQFLFGSPDAMIRIDMAEYMERYSVSRLIGAAPGYVGFEQGGALTSALMSHPNSVVLLDEVEKAHPDIMNIFLQVFDAGRLTDGQGRTVDASHALFIMTSNIGIQPGLPPQESMIRMQINHHFRVEFLNRIDDIIMFNQLQPQFMEQIVRIQLDHLRQILASKGLLLRTEPEVIPYLADRGYDPIMGARPLQRLINKEIFDPIVQLMILDELAPGHAVCLSYDGIRINIAKSSGDTQ